MTDFLTFLNTADAEALSKIPGVDPDLALNIVEARPFAFIEDVLRVQGMNKNLLSEAEFYYAREMDPDHPQEADAVDEPPSAPVTQTQSPPSYSARVKLAAENVLRSALRLLVTAGVLLAGALFLYYTLPVINRQFMAPVEQNSAQINRLASDLATLQAQVNQTQHSVDALQKSLDAQSATIKKLEQMQATLEAQSKRDQSAMLLELRHQLAIAQALELLGRARVLLTQNNPTAARADIRSARDLLAASQSAVKDALIDKVIARLDTVVANLPGSPSAASSNLETAWQSLLDGKDPALQTPPAASTNTPSVTATFTPRPSATATP